MTTPTPEQTAKAEVIAHEWLSYFNLHSRTATEKKIAALLLPLLSDQAECERLRAAIIVSQLVSDRTQAANTAVAKERDEQCRLKQNCIAELEKLRTREAALSTSCPCCHTTPCHPRCTCAAPASSFGCLRCCKYGSKEQQRHIAEGIVAREAALIEQLETANLCVKGLEGNVDALEKEHALLMAVARAAKDYVENRGPNPYWIMKDTLTALPAAGVDLKKP